MVDSESGDLKNNGDFRSDFESEKKKLDSSDETNLSFYECPTAAASIQGFGEVNRYSSNSLESDNDYNFEESGVKSDSSQNTNSLEGYNISESNPNFTEGGSVSISQFTKASGGYFAGYQAVLYQGTPTLKDKPESFLKENPAVMTQVESNPHHPQMNVQHLNNAEQTHTVVTDFTVEGNLSTFPSNFSNNVSNSNYSPTLVNPAVHTTFEPTMTTGTFQPSTEQPVPFTVTSVRSENATTRNDFLNTGVNSVTSLSPTGTNLPQNALLPAIVEGTVANSDNSWTGQTSSGVSYVQEGFGTITVPKYRPVEVVERTVEVPVVHHIDTFVPKKEIQKIESYVKKPYTKYIDKVVEVPQVHYTDKIVEVPEYHEVTKTVPKVEVKEKTNYVPKVEVKVVPKYVEVPVVKIVDKYEEYEQVEEVVKHVEKVEVVEVPREVVRTVVKPVRKVVEKEKIVPVYEHRDVPVEKIKYVPKVETVEHVREVPKVVDVPVPYNVPRHQYVDQPYVVPKYKDVPVAVPVAKTVKPVYEPGPTNFVDVPVHKPYFVIHDHLNFKPVNNNSFNPNFGVSFNQTTNTNNWNTTHSTFPDVQGAQNSNLYTFDGTGFNNTNLNSVFNKTNNQFGYTTSSNPGQFPNDLSGPDGNNPHDPGFNGGFFNNLPREQNNPQQFNTNSVSYRVVGMNKLDMDKMAPEEKKLAQAKLDEALNNPNFQVYKQSLLKNDLNTNVADNNNFNFQNVNFNPNTSDTNTFNNTQNFTNNTFTNSNTEFNVQQGHGKGHNFDGNDDNWDFKRTPSGNFTNNWNKWTPEFGTKYSSNNWNKWAPNNVNYNSDFNLNNKYKYDNNLTRMGSSGSLLSWTEKLFQFFTGSKSPVYNNNNLLNSNPFNSTFPNKNNLHQDPKHNLKTNTQNVTVSNTDNNPFNDYNLPGTGSTTKMWNKNNYNLVQESFRNWRVPNMHLDLEKNTPTNKMFFKDTDQYYMSSGSGSVGHRASQSMKNSQTFPTSDSNTPKVH